MAEVAEYDEFHFHHQMPGGMISNLRYQLSTVGLEDRLEDILEEAGQVRADLGYPIVVSPFAQYIITQSVLNVMGRNQGKPRYESVPDEVRLYVRGGYGKVVGDIDPNLYDKIVRGAEPITERPGAHVPLALDRLRNTRGPFASDDDLLLAAYYPDKEYSELKRAGPIRLDTDSIGNTPLVTLIKQLALASVDPIIQFNQQSSLTRTWRKPAMSEPCIITVAITGAVPRKEDNPAVPVVPSEQIESTHEAFEAGASLVHIHVRNADQSPGSDPEKFREIQEGVKKHCPGMIIQFSTGGRGRGLEQRGAMLSLRPDMASLATGSVNFPTSIYENPPDFVEQLASTMLDHDIKPEIEIFDVAMLYNAANLVRKELLKPPVHVQFVLGIPNALPARRQLLDFLISDPESCSPIQPGPPQESADFNLKSISGAWNSGDTVEPDWRTTSSMTGTAWPRAMPNWLPKSSKLPTNMIDTRPARKKPGTC